MGERWEHYSLRNNNQNEVWLRGRARAIVHGPIANRQRR